MFFNKLRKYRHDEKDLGQQNLDLSVIPDPIDPRTGQGNKKQRRLALRVARKRIKKMTNELNNHDLNVTFKKVTVGGNTAVYQYYTAHHVNLLPAELDSLKMSISTKLRLSSFPMITMNNNILNISVPNGVNIPVDFKDIIRNGHKESGSGILGSIGEDFEGNNIDFELNRHSMPHVMLFGKVGIGETATIMSILYSIMSRTDPEHLRILYVDGNGSLFDFMRTDNADDPGYHPNPFTYAYPADASIDIDYARGLIRHLVKVVNSRIDLFKKEKVSDIDAYNEKHPHDTMYKILTVVDEFSAITDLDKKLKEAEMEEKGMINNCAYLIKMGPLVGIHLLMANHTARKEKVPEVISSNIPGRISLGLAEPFESDVALPDSGIAVHLINQVGEFYSSLKGIEHGNSPYLPCNVMFAINDSLEREFGHHDYIVSRDQIMNDMNCDD